ncbi:hypothetical protein ACGFYY_29750 [Streptomyces sp. NPDC048331]|uniref:hypothetical protein n=1 Tax=Streptomyces sp. NPDC048331 TaxID=3365534 RepID=UPI00371CAC60
MTAVHRPLTTWVRDARPTAPHPGATTPIPGQVRGNGGTGGSVPGPFWTAYGPVNEGDERADARSLDRFRTGWERGSLPLSGGGHALALIDPTTGEAVLELDGLGQPLPADPVTAEAVAAIERRWPAERLEPIEQALLAAAAPGLRYSLLDRLAAEGRPEPDCFHVLPWERVDRLADEVTAALDASGPAHGDTPAHRPVRLRHYFAPAGSRFTAALEQLGSALRASDPRRRRVATTALCARLAGAATGRIPRPTRERLILLLDAVGRGDAFLSATAALAVERLAGAFAGPGGASAGPGRADVVWHRLDYGRPASVRNEFAPAAAGGADSAQDGVLRSAFTLTLTVQDDSALYIAVSAPLDTADAALLAQGYDEVLLLPVHVTGAVEGGDLYVLLMPFDDGLSGDLKMTAVAEAVVTADQAGPPLGLADLPFLDPEAVRRTLACQVRASDRRSWRALLDRLPAGHPVRRAAEGA